VHRIATASFTITEWNEEPWDEREGSRLTRAHVTKAFEGDLEGTSEAELLLAYSPGTASRAYVGFERIDGVLNGRKGSFVLHHTATSSGAGQAVSWQIVPDSGTHQLEQIRGEAQIVLTGNGGHELTLDYELP
jgi:hypothetical protein